MSTTDVPRAAEATLPPELSPREPGGPGSRGARPLPPEAGPPPHRRGRGRVELTPLGSVVLLLVVGLAGIALDLAASGGPGLAFGVAFAAASAAAAWWVRPADRFVPLVATPLVYLPLATLGGAGGSTSGGRSGLIVSSLTAVITSAPVLIVAVLACTAVTVLRLRRGR